MTKNIAIALLTAVVIAQGMAQTPAAPTSDFAAAQKQFDTLCAGCHGEGGNGGDRVPALVNNRSCAPGTERKSVT